MYSDSKISDFLSGIEDELRIGFLNEWNAAKDHREKIYISYDSTNKNCQAGELQMVEFGHPKEDKGLPVFNYSVAYDTNNREPLFYEQYPGSIVDVSQLQFMLEKAKGYGYKHVGFILDRGYFSKENIGYMDDCGYDFVIMVKGMNSLVKELVMENRGSFEEDRDCHIREYRVFGTTIKRQLYATDKKERYFHLYYSEQSDKVAAGKIFVEFVALIVRNRIYTLLKDEMKKLDKKPNYMTVPAALRELEKIEMIRMTDGKYRMDHAVTATQKTILNAFGIDSSYIKKATAQLTDMLCKTE